MKLASRASEASKEIVTARIARALRNQIADRKQLTVGVEVENRTPSRGPSRERSLQGPRGAHSEGGGCVRRLIEITAMAADRTPDCLRPEQHICADIVVPFDRETAPDIGNRLGLSGKS